MRGIFLCVLLVVSAIASTQAASCTFAARTFHSYSDIQTCLKQVPFSDKLRQVALSNLRKTFSLYAFKDIVKNSPASGSLAHIQTDLFAEFDRIASATYASDFEFQTDIADVILSLKDPHTVYQKGSCYSFFALQPFVLRSRLNSMGLQEIWISDLYFYATQWPQLNLERFVNSTLVTVDGVPALQALTQWAIDNEFESKDDGSNFNRVLDSHFQQRIAAIFPLPKNPSQTYEIQDATGQITTVTIPWLVDTVQPVTFDARCTGAGMNSLAVDEKFVAAMESPITRRKALRTRYPAMKQQKHQRRRNDFAILRDQADTPSIEIFNLTSQVVVTRIHDFVPRDTYGFLDTFDSLLDYAERSNIPYMILDLRGNGGGDICLGYQLINRLMHERHPEGDYDVIKSPLMQAMFEAGQKSMSARDLFGPGFFSDANGKVQTDLSWYYNSRVANRGGVVGNYSQIVHHACKYKDWPTDWVFKKVLVISDGLCGSTCAVVSTHLADLDHVDTLVVGGVWGNKQQYFSFPGGQVMSYSNLLTYGQYLGLSRNPLMPQAFPNGAQQSFTFLEIYPWTILNDDGTPTKNSAPADDPRLTTPLEFVWDPADFRLPMWNFADDDDVELWNAVVPFFQKDPPRM